MAKELPDKEIMDALVGDDDGAPEIPESETPEAIIDPQPTETGTTETVEETVTTAEDAEATEATTEEVAEAVDEDTPYTSEEWEALSDEKRAEIEAYWEAQAAPEAETTATVAPEAQIADVAELKASIASLKETIEELRKPAEPKAEEAKPATPSIPGIDFSPNYKITLPYNPQNVKRQSGENEQMYQTRIGAMNLQYNIAENRKQVALDKAIEERMAPFKPLMDMLQKAEQDNTAMEQGARAWNETINQGVKELGLDPRNPSVKQKIDATIQAIGEDGLTKVGHTLDAGSRNVLFKKYMNAGGASTGFIRKMPDGVKSGNAKVTVGKTAKRTPIRKMPNTIGGKGSGASAIPDTKRSTDVVNAMLSDPS